MFLFAGPITRFLNPGKKSATKVTMFRTLNVVFMFLHILDLLLGGSNPVFEDIFIHIAGSMGTIYLSILVFNIVSYFSRQKFGNIKKLDDKEVHIDSYNSRLVDLFLIVFTVFLDFYILIQIWNWDSMLETTGLFGVLLGFLALTNQIWAPDLFYGMVVLNSQQIEDGDVIQLNDDPHEYIINKITFIYTILLDVRNNHRTMIRNSKMMEMKIDNLSKRASSEGLRFSLTYKIGYPNICSTEARPDRERQFGEFQAKINSMFGAVNGEMVTRNSTVRVNANYPLEWHLTTTGDHALEYTLYYSLESLPNTKVTRTIRNFLVASHHVINEEVYKQSILYGVDLATPFVVQQV